MAQLKFSKKHKIKEDHFVESVFKARHWALEHIRLLYTAGSILVVIFFIVFIVAKTNNSRTSRAKEFFGKAMIAYQSSDTVNTVPEFKHVLTDFAKTPYAAISSFMLGSIYYNKGNYDIAEKYFNRNVKDFGSYKFLKGASINGIGNCYIQKKEYGKAIESLKKFVKEFPDNYLMPEVLLSLGECYIKQNNPEAARSIFQRLVSNFSESGQSKTARNLISTL